MTIIVLQSCPASRAAAINPKVIVRTKNMCHHSISGRFLTQVRILEARQGGRRIGKRLAHIMLTNLLVVISNNRIWVDLSIKTLSNVKTV
jgi:hypothetical protein